MVRLYFLNGENATEAAVQYVRENPGHRHPRPAVIEDAHRRLRETGVLIPQNAANGANGGRARRVRNPAREDAIMRRVRNDRRTSTRRVGRAMGISHSVVNRVLREYLMHPYHFTRVQTLMPGDREARFNFAQMFVEQTDIDNNFSRRIVWSDECTFTRDGSFNTHNMHFYNDRNPHASWNSRSQNRFKINVWAALADNELVSLHLDLRRK